MPDETHTVEQKASAINQSRKYYGTFAEIGAGQEVVRWFFQAGRASATVAKTISAYDMSVSDGLYGPARRYVSRERLEAMLDHEFQELVESLARRRGETSSFFVFADTVATRTHAGRETGHGWLGVRFQAAPLAEPSELIIHVEMMDDVTVEQQEAVGRAGVNLIYGALYLHDDPSHLISTLMDGLGRRRAEIDMIKFSGPAFGGVDNRLMSLQLVEQGLTDAAMFMSNGETVQPSEVLYNKPVLIERGSFRPVTDVTLEMLESARRQLPPSQGTPGKERMVLMEMTLNNLLSESVIDHRDFLARVDILCALNQTVLISNYTRFDRVTSYLRRYTKDWIGMVMGVPTLREVFDEKYYTDLEGGILEGLGRLFQGPSRLFVYPTCDAGSGELKTADSLEVQPHLQHLYVYLLESGFIEPIREYGTGDLKSSPGNVLERLQAGDPSWEGLVPPQAVKLIKQGGFFGYRATTDH